MKYSQKSHSSAGYHNMTVVLFTLLCVLTCGSLALSPKAQTKTSDEHVTPKSVPGRNGKIAFTGGDGIGAIYTTEADGSNVQRLTRNPRHDISPRWSPDGTKIAFESVRDNNGEIYVMNADGSNQTRLTNNPAYDFWPIFSPDGTRIAFGSRRDNNIEIYVMNADGSNQTRLTNDPADDYSYAWSPDSSRIAFTRGGDIYVMDADGTNQTRLTTGGIDGSPRWSPDGTRIAFLSGSVAGSAGISVMKADGSNQTRLTNAYSYSDSPPDWSPDGSRIAFLSNPDNNYDIYVINADGSNQTRLTNDPAFDSSPVFSPDGTRIAFLSDRDKIDNGWNYNDKIYVMNADGSSQTRLTNTAAELYEFKPDWHALPQAAANPIDTVDFFVRQHYLDFLSREPDAAGLAFWTGEIEGAARTRSAARSSASTSRRPSSSPSSSSRPATSSTACTRRPSATRPTPRAGRARLSRAEFTADTSASARAWSSTRRAGSSSSRRTSGRSRSPSSSAQRFIRRLPAVDDARAVRRHAQREHRRRALRRPSATRSWPS